MAPPALPRIKRIVRSTDMAEAKAAARAVFNAAGTALAAATAAMRAVLARP